jgi:hypothetical protein
VQLQALLLAHGVGLVVLLPLVHKYLLDRLLELRPYQILEELLHLDPLHLPLYHHLLLLLLLLRLLQHHLRQLPLLERSVELLQVQPLH